MNILRLVAIVLTFQTHPSIPVEYDFPHIFSLKAIIRLPQAMKMDIKPLNGGTHLPG